MLQKSSILGFLSAHKAALQRQYQVEKIGLFGSFAQDTQTDDSDIDILIEFAPGTAELYEKKMAIRALLANAFGRPVDLCREKYIKPYFRAQILESAIYV